MNPDYWRRIHAATGDDLAVVNYPSFPPAFNRLVDRIFTRPVIGAVATLPPGVALEVGCGRGRWLRRLRGLGWTTHGVDIAPSGRPGAVAEASRLPVRGGTVDLVLAITVLQHVDAQAEALGEMIRAVKPGGSLLLVEVLDRPGVRWQAHVRPRSAAWWRERIEGGGMRIVREDPVEYLPLLRLLERRAMRGPAEGTDPAPSPRLSPARYAAGTALAWASALLEPLGPVVTPGGASHRLWLARKG